MTIKAVHIPWKSYSKPIKSRRTAEILANTLLKYAQSVRVKSCESGFQISLREKLK